jgi:hypothetical protein
MIPCPIAITVAKTETPWPIAYSLAPRDVALVQ